MSHKGADQIDFLIPEMMFRGKGIDVIFEEIGELNKNMGSKINLVVPASYSDIAIFTAYLYFVKQLGLNGLKLHYDPDLHRSFDFEKAVRMYTTDVEFAQRKEGQTIEFMVQKAMIEIEEAKQLLRIKEEGDKEKFPFKNPVSHLCVPWSQVSKWPQ